MSELGREHYSDGRRWSQISHAWILESSWNDREELAVTLNAAEVLRKENVTLRARLEESIQKDEHNKIVGEVILSIDAERAEFERKIEELTKERLRLQERIHHQRLNLSRKYLGWAETKVGMQREIEFWRAEANGEVPTFGHGAKYEEIASLERQLAAAQETIAGYRAHDKAMAEAPAQHWEDSLRCLEDERNQLQSTVTAQAKDIQRLKDYLATINLPHSEQVKQIEAQREEIGRLSGGLRDCFTLGRLTVRAMQRTGELGTERWQKLIDLCGRIDTDGSICKESPMREHFSLDSKEPT